MTAPYKNVHTITGAFNSLFTIKYRIKSFAPVFFSFYTLDKRFGKPSGGLLSY